MADEIPSTEDSCTIRVDWDPPTDTPPEDISHYIVRDSINGAHEATSETSKLVTFSSSKCTNDLSFSISAVDRCSQKGPSSDNVKPNFLPPTDPATDTTTPSGTPSTTTTTITTTTNTPASDTGTTLGERLGGVFGAGELISKDTTLFCTQHTKDTWVELCI